MASFAMMYAANPVSPFSATEDPKLTIAPPPRAFMCGWHACMA